MAYPINETFTEDIVLNAIEREANGVKTLAFIPTDCIYDMLEVAAVTEYFNPLLGEYDSTKTTVYFHGSHSMIVDSFYITVASKIAPYINPQVPS